MLPMHIETFSVRAIARYRVVAPAGRDGGTNNKVMLPYHATDAY
jgi:hypothetical protein